MQFINFNKIDFKIPGLDEVKLPKMVKIRQKYDSAKIEDLKGFIEEEMDKTIQNKADYQGKSICITVGSRGIPHLDLMVKTIAEKLKEYGANPFIIPSMGSHGGASVEGQIEILEGYGITEKTMGVPIRATLDVVQIGELLDKTPVYCDKYAYESDGIVILNKIKPHTDFRGKHESGLAKMMAIGIANHKGASMFHRMGFQSFARRIPEVCEVFLQNAKLAFGVGIVQNAYDEISELEIIPTEKFLERDAALLEIAKEKIAKFKNPDFDLLIIDEIGKNISGNGHDPNITGRSNSKGFEDVVNIQKLFIRGISKESHHNGAGIKGADITTRRCLNDIDFSSTWTNVATVNILTGGSIPMYVETDLEAIKVCIRTCLGIDYTQAKIVRILNTLHMNEIEVSLPYYETLKDNPEIELLSEPYDMQFDENDFLI